MCKSGIHIFQIILDEMGKYQARYFLWFRIGSLKNTQEVKSLWMNNLEEHWEEES